MVFNDDTALKRKHFQLKETIVTIIAENDAYIEVAKKEIRKLRNQIEQFIQRDEFFEVSLKPFGIGSSSVQLFSAGLYA